MAKPRSDFSQMNRRWRTNLLATQWVRIWKKVWGSLTFYRDWVIIWRVCYHGFFHNHRDQIWGMNEGICPCCQTHMETLKHMLFECNFVWRRWAAIAVWLMCSHLAPTFMKGSLGEIMYVGITKILRNPVSLEIIIEMIANI